MIKGIWGLIILAALTLTLSHFLKGYSLLVGNSLRDGEIPVAFFFLFISIYYAYYFFFPSKFIQVYGLEFQFSDYFNGDKFYKYIRFKPDLNNSKFYIQCIIGFFKAILKILFVILIYSVYIYSLKVNSWEVVIDKLLTQLDETYFLFLILFILFLFESINGIYNHVIVFKLKGNGIDYSYFPLTQKIELLDDEIEIQYLNWNDNLKSIKIKGVYFPKLDLKNPISVSKQNYSKEKIIELLNLCKIEVVDYSLNK